MLEALVLPDGAWRGLAERAAARGLVFLSTAFDARSLELLEDLGVPAHKVPSGELTNLAFVRELASRGRPLLVSTGMATEEEVAAALHAATAAPGVALLHCVTAYPTPVADANLRAIPTLAARFGVPVGWSDHTAGAVTAVAAVALGATVLEKHLTLDRGRPGPDHAASSDPEGFTAYVDAVRDAEAALGDGRKRPAAAEEENRRAARRSWHARRALAVGEVLADGDVEALRPATGLAPDVPVVGRRVARPVVAGAPLRAEDLA
jgi:N,N'-diacetyllegionaminate synthase